MDKFSFEYDLCLQGQVPKGDIGQVGTATSAAREADAAESGCGRCRQWVSFAVRMRTSKPSMYSSNIPCGTRQHIVTRIARDSR